MVQQQEQYVFCYEAVAEEAEHLGLIPKSPVLPRSRMLSVSTSSLPSPSSSSSNLRTSSSSYISSPTSVPPSPNWETSSNYTPNNNFLNSSTTSLPSPPASPYLHAASLDYSSASDLFANTTSSQTSTNKGLVDYPSPSSLFPSPSEYQHEPRTPSSLFPTIEYESRATPVDCHK